MKTENQSSTFRCVDCNQTKPVQKDGGTGYATASKGKVCYACCGERDKKDMIATGKAVHYLSKKGDKWVFGNWPGTLEFPILRRTVGIHNIGGTRDDVWFIGPDGKKWHGVQIGQNSQICRARRLKG